MSRTSCTPQNSLWVYPHSHIWPASSHQTAFRTSKMGPGDATLHNAIKKSGLWFILVENENSWKRLKLIPLPESGRDGCPIVWVLQPMFSLPSRKHYHLDLTSAESNKDFVSLDCNTIFAQVKAAAQAFLQLRENVKRWDPSPQLPSLSTTNVFWLPSSGQLTQPLVIIEELVFEKMVFLCMHRWLPQATIQNILNKIQESWGSFNQNSIMEQNPLTQRKGVSISQQICQTYWIQADHWLNCIISSLLPFPP